MPINHINTALKASIKAGAAIMEIYQQDFTVEIKSDNSPLTQADKNANSVINSFLEKTAIPIISEENKQLGFSVRKNWDTCWMVDPLDGTKEFVKRNGEFTVNIALIKKGQPVLGVIYVPVTKTLYYANIKEKKAYKCELDKHQYCEDTILNNQIEIRPEKKGGIKTKVVGSRSHKNQNTEDFINNLIRNGVEVDLISKGSSLKFCLVAEGKASMYPRFAPTMEWDTAAGHAICNAVGLKVRLVHQDREIQYNKENLLNPYFIVQQ